MRKILRLIGKDLRLLKRTIIMMAIILCIFISVFLSVINVRRDLSRSFINHFDKEDIYAYLSVYNVSKNDILKLIPNEYLLLGRKTNLTEDASFQNEAGEVFDSMRVDTSEEITSIKIYSGTIVNLNDELSVVLEQVDNTLISGTWVNDQNQINISSDLARYLQVETGSYLYIDDFKFLIVGIYDAYEFILSDIPINSDYILTIDSNEKMDEIKIHHSQASVLYSINNKFKAAGHSSSLSQNLLAFFKNVKTMETTLLAVALLLIAIIILILYSLTSLILLYRRGFISQLKLIGTSDKDVMYLYVSIIIAVIIITTLLATILSIYFNDYILRVATDLFAIEFRASINFTIPALFIFISSLFAFILYSIVNKQTKTRRIAEMIRNDR